MAVVRLHQRANSAVLQKGSEAAHSLWAGPRSRGYRTIRAGRTGLPGRETSDFCHLYGTKALPVPVTETAHSRLQRPHKTPLTVPPIFYSTCSYYTVSGQPTLRCQQGPIPALAFVPLGPHKVYWVYLWSVSCLRESTPGTYRVRSRVVVFGNCQAVRQSCTRNSEGGGRCAVKCERASQSGLWTEV